MSIAIVGASGAVGRALARRVHLAGHRPWLIGRNVAELEEISDECGGAEVTVADMLQTDDIAGILKPAVPKDCRGFAYCTGDIVLKIIFVCNKTTST